MPCSRAIGRDVFQIEIGFPEIIPEHLDHGGVRPDGSPQLFAIAHLDDLDAQRADRVIVHIAGFAGNDHLILQSFEVRQPLNFFRVRSDQTGRGGMGQSGGRARRHNGPVDVQQFREAGAHALHQLVEIHMEVRGLLHRRDHFRERQRAAVDGERRGAVDERADSDPGVNIGARSGSARRWTSRKPGCDGSAGLKQSPPAETGLRSVRRMGHSRSLGDDNSTLPWQAAEKGVDPVAGARGLPVIDHDPTARHEPPVHRCWFGL